MKLGGVDKNDHSSSQHMTLDCRVLILTTDGTKVKLIPTLVCVMLTKIC